LGGHKFKSKRLPLGLGALGGLLVVPGVLWFAASGTRLNDDDVSSALKPLTQIHLDSIDEKPLSVTLIIPHTARGFARRGESRNSSSPQ